MGHRVALLSCVLALTCVGCGTTDREHDAAAAAKRFHAAVKARDGEAACAQLNPETASKLQQQEKKPCQQAIVTIELPKGASVAETRVYETSAFAQLAEGGADFLDESAEGWWVSAAGCNQSEPEQPYDCELEN